MKKNSNSKQLFEQALQIKQICQYYHTPLLINDRVDIALAVGADGVHLGQSDLPANIARQLLGNDKIIGVSARTVEQAQSAKQHGADYLGVGAIFTTKTKGDAVAIDLVTVQQIFQTVDLPMILIGGIHAENLATLQKNLTDLKVNPTGFAVVSAILAQENIYQASQNLLDKLVNIQLC